MEWYRGKGTYTYLSSCSGLRKRTKDKKKKKDKTKNKQDDLEDANMADPKSEAGPTTDKGKKTKGATDEPSESSSDKKNAKKSDGKDAKNAKDKDLFWAQWSTKYP